MKLADIPAKFTLPFANDATAGHIRTIPQAPTGTPGQASLQLGFPPENFIPVSAGGVPPFGQDFNGLHNQETAWNRWQGTGMFPPYDPTWQTAVGGYPQGSIVQSLQRFGLFWLSLVDDNTTDPDTGGAGWYAWSSILTQNVDIYVNPSTGSDTYNGSSPTVSGNNGPFATLTKALSVVGFFLPSTFGATINLAAGTYNGGSTGFASSNFAHCNVTITGAGATSIITSSGTSASALSIQGPNNYRLQNFAISSTSTFTGGFQLISVVGGATCTLAGGITCAGCTTAPAANFVKCGAATCFIAGSVTISGSMGYSGNYGYYFSSSGGNVSMGASPVITISAAVTCDAFASAFNGGLLGVASSAPSFVNPGNVTGKKYSVVLNGIINTGGLGASYFPGSVAGSTATGGQYA